MFQFQCSILKNRSAMKFYVFASVSSSFGKMSRSGSSKVVLVSGANRGIGLGLIRELIRRGGCSVVATCRCPSASGASELRELMESSGQGWDFSVKSFAFKRDHRIGPDRSIDKPGCLVFI